MHPTELIDQYSVGPELLRHAILGMTDEQLDAVPIPGRWSTRQVLCHIADFELVYAARIKRVLAEEEPTFFGGDPDTFAAGLVYKTRDVEEELRLIESIRSHLTRILRSMDESAFQRLGKHSEAGVLSLENLLQRIMQHLPHHVAFIEEKKQALCMPSSCPSKSACLERWRLKSHGLLDSSRSQLSSRCG